MNNGNFQDVIDWTDEVGEECKRILGDNVSALDNLSEKEIGGIIIESAFDEDCTVEQCALKVIKAAGIEL